MDNSHLIDPSAKNYLFQTLKQCHNHRVNIYYYVLNISIFIVFAIIVFLTLYYCHKNKLTDYQKAQKMIRDQQYVMSKIRFYQEETRDAKTSNVTQLPFQ
jgi:hypothetical protein